ncbi:hypothetical protein D3C73_1195740 [compost metagenome]
MFLPRARIKHQIVAHFIVEHRQSCSEVLPVRLTGLVGVAFTFELRSRRRYEATVLEHLLSGDLVDKRRIREALAFEVFRELLLGNQLAQPCVVHRIVSQYRWSRPGRGVNGGHEKLPFYPWLRTFRAICRLT